MTSKAYVFVDGMAPDPVICGIDDWYSGCPERGETVMFKFKTLFGYELGLRNYKLKIAETLLLLES